MNFIKKKIAITVTIVLILVLVDFIESYAQNVLEEINQVIELKEDATIYLGPGEDYEEVDVLLADTLIFAMALVDNEWYKIYYNYNEAYIHKNFFKEIVPVVLERIEANQDIQTSIDEQIILDHQSESAMIVLENVFNENSAQEFVLYIALIIIAVVFIVGFVIISKEQNENGEKSKKS